MYNRLNFKQTFAALILFALAVQMFSFSVLAQSLKNEKSEEVSQETKLDEQADFTPKSKIAPDLEEKTDELFNGLRGDEVQKVIIQLKSDSQMNEMFGNDLSEDEQARILAREIQANRDKKGLLMSDLTAANGRIKKSFYNIGLVSAELPLSQVKELIKSENVQYISPDREVAGLGHVGWTAGVYNTGISDRGDSDPNTWLIGTGIGVAVIDSGVYGTHDLFKKWDDSSKVTSYDFTGTNTTDQYGHGSHVASILSGDHRLGGAAYEGTANGVSVYSLKALGQYGIGTTTNVIAAIDWAIANKASKNIRVINMSLGTPAMDSYVNDPLCQASRRAVNAGIVVVASAGNYGKSLTGAKLYGTIGSPGIEPSVITVGATNTLGTDIRSDDTVATFSSRGPTRGYRIVNGARKYDNLIKPDIVASGNKIIGAASPNSTTRNFVSKFEDRSFKRF